MADMPFAEIEDRQRTVENALHSPSFVRSVNFVKYQLFVGRQLFRPCPLVMHSKSADRITNGCRLRAELFSCVSGIKFTLTPGRRLKPTPQFVSNESPWVVV
jgi:hypothetical protein